MYVVLALVRLGHLLYRVLMDEGPAEEAASHVFEVSCRCRRRQADHQISAWKQLGGGDVGMRPKVIRRLHVNAVEL